MKYLGRISVMAVAAVFITSGLSKAMAPDAFEKSLASYQGLSSAAAVAIGFYLPWLELCIAGGAMLAAWRPAALAIAMLLLLMMMLVAVAELARGNHPPCGCFGPDHRLGAASLILQAAVLGLAWIGFMDCRRVKQDGSSMAPKTASP